MKLITIEHSQWAYCFDLFFYGTSPWVLAVWVMTYGPAPSRMALLSLVMLGFLAWTLMEYVLHRFILHGLAPFSQWHEEHHQRPMALICMPTAVSLGLIYLLAFLPNYWFFGFWPAVALSLGVLCGYAAYTLLTRWCTMQRTIQKAHGSGCAGSNFTMPLTTPCTGSLALQAFTLA